MTLLKLYSRQGLKFQYNTQEYTYIVQSQYFDMDILNIAAFNIIPFKVGLAERMSDAIVN